MAGWLEEVPDEMIRVLAHGTPEESKYAKELKRRGLEPIPSVTRDVDKVDIATAQPRLGYVEDGIGDEEVPYSQQPFAEILTKARAGDEAAGEELVLRAPFTYTADGQLTPTGQKTMEEFGLA